MTLRISLLLLLANCAIVFAQPLYKWVEPDGSITFSPEPPAKGVNYERVDSVTTAPGLASQPATRIEGGNDSLLPDDLNSSSPVSPVAPLPRIQYAPGNDADMPPALSRTDGTRRSDSLIRPMPSALAIGQTRTQAEQAASTSDSFASSVTAANYKRSRCQDLQKRVTSLERRLKSRLTPEDMDNTVIHMARYQRSFDQYCAQ